jgi:hypothetical protein
MRQEHDKGYRTLLSNPEVFTGLLKAFIREPWTERIDPHDLEPVKTSFILPTFERREADIIYKLKDTAENPPVYVYCLMELQSSVDYAILIRLLFYMTSFWMELLKGLPPDALNRADFRLPMIIPLVLYNGGEGWTVSREFSSVYGGNIEPFREYLINFKYHLIDVNRYTREELLGIKGLMSAVFLVDQKGADAGTGAYLRDLAEKFRLVPLLLRDATLREGSIFLQWMKGIILERLPCEGGAFRDVIEEHLRKLEAGTEAGMFVSNFAADFRAFVEGYDADMRSLRLAREEKARILRQAVRALQSAGFPAEVIAQKMGCPQEEIETILSAYP